MGYSSSPRWGLITGITIAVLVVLIAISVGTCSIAPPYKERYEEIDTDETAFVIPLEEGTKAAQQQFESVDFLQEHKVAAKRVITPQRLSKQGRFRRSSKWVPLARVVKVSRAWVSREWTEERETGTTEKQQALRMESKDSIGFKIPCNLTAYVAEEHTALFLYRFGGRPLEDIIDGPIRNDAQSELAIRFGDVNLRDIIAVAKGKLSEEEMARLGDLDVSKKTIFEEAHAALVKKYKDEGITIPTFGPAGQLHYEETEIQGAINKAFAAEIDVKAAKSEKLAEDTRIAMRKAAAQAFEMNVEAQMAIKELEIRAKVADALVESAKKGQPIVPQVNSGSEGNMILQLVSPVAK